MVTDKLWVDVVHHHQLHLVFVDSFLFTDRQTDTQRWQQHSSAGGLTSLTDSLLNQYTACNLEQVVNLLHTRVNSASYPLQDG